MNRQVASWKWLKESLLSGKTVSNYVTDSSPSDGESVTYKDLKNNFAVSGKVDDFSNKTDTPSKIYIHQYSKSSSNYELNQVINREDLSVEGQDKFITNIDIVADSSYLNGKMDPMGGVKLKAIKHYNTGETEEDTNQDNFSITKLGNSNTTSESLYINGTDNININNVNVVFNCVNDTSSTITRTILVNYLNKSQYLSLSQINDNLGHFTNGRGEITDGQNNSKKCSNLTDSNWSSEFLNDYGSGMKNAGIDWYITTEKDTKYRQGSELPANPIPTTEENYNYNRTHTVTDANISIPYKISWLKDEARDYWIYDGESYSRSISCTSDYIQDQTEHTISISPSHIINYVKPEHRYGEYAILYAESYPDKFRDANGFPKIIDRDLVNNTKSAYGSISNSDCTNSQQAVSGQSSDPTGTTFEQFSTNLAERDFSTADNKLTFTNLYTFLSPEICKRDSDNHIVYDTTESSTRTVYGNSTQYNYNMSDTVTTEQKYSQLTAENNIEYASDSCGTTWPSSSYDVYLILPYEYTFTTMDQAITDGYLKGSDENIPLPTNNPIIGRDSLGIEHHKYEISSNSNYVNVYELRDGKAEISSTKRCKVNYYGTLTNNNNISVTKSFNLVDTTGPANITCDRSDIIINPTSITTTGSNTFTVSFNTSNRTPGDVSGTIICSSYTMKFSVTDQYNKDSLPAYGNHQGFPDSISRSQLKAAGLDKGNVF